jgi:tetratricopeptide (TPR) repeat protein
MTVLEDQLYAARARVEALEPDDHSEGARRTLEAFGGWCRALGLWEEALKAYDRGLRLCEPENDPTEVSRFLTWKSNVFFHSGIYGRAVEFATQAVSVSPTDLEKAGRMSYFLGLPHLMLGDISNYVSLQQQALDILPTAPEDERERRVAWYRTRLAKGLLLQGDADDARQLIAEQVHAFRQTNPKFGLPWAQLVRGAVEVELSNFAEAEAALAESLSIYERNQQEAYVVDVLTEQSKLAVAQGEPRQAVALAEQAVAEARKGPRVRGGLADTRHLNFALAQAARAYLEIRDRERAAAAYDEALRLAAATNRGLIMRDLLRLGISKALR